ncbi:Asp-tRNA(Asn)/Glu-tRNA(Gln) amidotransferase subunit GatC [uncultured Parasutterella sp.]|uniref:Asp-tRNA(Asn)/Glu-tRNA(Gln) amidotransferase subunit GatC n=1 Tax=uncultured Parasutterella sp. TaxID=1263098 RepID=UPI00272AB551|nr:Asp-tRNA(Asn)/Glu-tRNA(Gln) amidotransferase subunit GatC [uncultured Parasutterella sp.]
MSLTINDVRRISDLARIDLSDANAEKLMVELNDILSMVEQIQSIDTTGVEPMPHPFGGAQRLREDEVAEHNRREENMQNAPDVMDGLFLVPKVIE